MGVKTLAYVAQLRSSADTAPNIKCIHTRHCTDIWSRQGVVDAIIFFIRSHTEVSCAKTSEKGSSDGLTIHQSALTIPQQCILYIYDIHYIINTYNHIENTIWIQLWLGRCLLKLHVLTIMCNCMVSMPKTIIFLAFWIWPECKTTLSHLQN